MTSGLSFGHIGWEALEGPNSIFYKPMTSFSSPVWIFEAPYLATVNAEKEKQYINKA